MRQWPFLVTIMAVSTGLIAVLNSQVNAARRVDATGSHLSKILAITVAPVLMDALIVAVTLLVLMSVARALIVLQHTDKQMGIKVSSTYSLAIGKKWLRLCSIGMDNDMRRWAIGTSIDKLNELTCKGISAPKVLAIAVHLGLGMIWGTLGSNRARVGGVLTGAAAGFGIACGIQGLTGLHPTPQSIVLVIALIALGGIIGGWASATATPAARHSAAGKKANDTDPKARP